MGLARGHGGVVADVAGVRGSRAEQAEGGGEAEARVLYSCANGTRRMDP
ncbi:hypothetical protein [Nocardia sp. XZ_19_369]|nr:hypothetical protein [Nocardia sp. XZ_19_369]